MAFTTAELQAIKLELGYNILQTGAVAYVGITQLFESVVNTYIDDEVETTVTLSTAISEASTPTPQTLTLADATGFATGALVYIDVDDRMEKRRIQYLSGTSATILLQKAHSGTFAVSLFGPIPRAREILWRIQTVKDEMGGTFGEGTIKKVDEVEFYQGGSKGSDRFESLGGQLRFWRNELASALGVTNAWELKAGGSCMTTLSVY